MNVTTAQMIEWVKHATDTTGYQHSESVRAAILAVLSAEWEPPIAKFSTDDVEALCAIAVAAATKATSLACQGKDVDETGALGHE